MKPVSIYGHNGERLFYTPQKKGILSKDHNETLVTGGWRRRSVDDQTKDSDT